MAEKNINSAISTAFLTLWINPNSAKSEYKLRCIPIKVIQIVSKDHFFFCPDGKPRALL